MRVDLRLFSILRERAGTGKTELELAEAATVSDAVHETARRFPALASLLAPEARLAIQTAVNREYAGQQHRLRAGDEVALFPPVSGGASEGDLGVLLLSGGFDSPVAGHLIQSSGRPLAAVHYSMEPFTDDASVKKAQALARALRIPRLFIVPLGEDLAQFTRHCEHRYYFVLLKRLMVRVSEVLARRLGATYLVTGENLGQVSSQTLPNLGVIDAVATLPILRPLLGMDKQDIIAFAERIGTFDLSRGPEVCDALGPRHPSTGATLEKVLAEEAKVDMEALVRNAVSKAYESPGRPGPTSAGSGPGARPVSAESSLP